MNFGTLLTMTMMNSLLKQSSNFRRLVWREEFDGDHLDDRRWIYEKHCGRFNSEIQCYTKHRQKNVRVENGRLIIEVRPERYHNFNFTSGRLLTRDSWRYGRFDIRARMPKGKHLWPAIWMLAKYETYGTWPTNGEIDIAEVIGDQANLMSSSMHYGPTEETLHSLTSGVKNFNVDLSKDFNLYSLEWTKKRMTWSFNNKPYYSVNLDKMMCCKRMNANEIPRSPYKRKGQPFDRPFYMILNVAVGGTFFGGRPYVTMEQAQRTWKKNTMEIDYIRIYQ